MFYTYGKIPGMKKAKKSKKYEPTIANVLDVVQTGFARNDKLLTELQAGFARHDRILATLHEGQENLRGQLKEVDRRLSNTQNRVEDIADSLGDITRVADKDRVSTLDHERRIRHLEKAQA